MLTGEFQQTLLFHLTLTKSQYDANSHKYDDNNDNIKHLWSANPLSSILFPKAEVWYYFQWQQTLKNSVHWLRMFWSSDLH